MSKLNPPIEDLSFSQTDGDQFSDSQFEDLPESRQPPEIQDEAAGTFVDEVPRPIAENQYFDFFGAQKDLSESSILHLFEKEGRMKDRRR